MSDKKTFVTFYRLSAKESGKDWRSEVDILRDELVALKKSLAERDRQNADLKKQLREKDKKHDDFSKRVEVSSQPTKRLEDLKNSASQSSEKMSATQEKTPEEMYELGKKYYVSQEYTEAVKWYKLSAEQGYAQAQNYIGYCYQHGKGVKKDYEEAVKWYRLSAEQGNSYAQKNLGNCYYDGYGVKRNYNEAVKWYKLSAEHGNPYGQCHLGDCYYYGKGVKKDYAEAVKWYKLAADNGSYIAKDKLKILGYI